MNNKVLVIDDDIEIVELVELYLRDEGYIVYKGYSGEEGLKIINKENIELVVLDIMMEGIDGLEVCRRIRQNFNIPIIFLSAKGQDTDKIIGLGIGADDYLVKPFNPLELVARVNAQLRRFNYLNTSKSKEVIEIKGITINKKNRKVSLYGKDIKLTKTEYEMLLLLAENRGQVLGAEKIFREVWKEEYFESNNTVMAHMWRLREKIETNPKRPEIIETVWGVGYKIEE